MLSTTNIWQRRTQILEKFQWNSKELKRSGKKQLLSQQEQIEKLLLQTQKENQEKQRKFQKQILKLTNRCSPIETEFSFSQNAIWSVLYSGSYHVSSSIAGV